MGWLYRSTRFAALTRLRDDRRRANHERLAMEQLLTNSESPPAWEHIRPLLDEALDGLDDTDREAVLLRYFKNLDLRSVGAALGVSDDAAQKRVSRSVERLREFFAKRGIKVGASGLTVLMAANAVQPAPVGLAATISVAAALTGTTLATTATATATKAIAMTTLQKTLVTVTIAVLAGAALFETRQAAKLRREVRALQEQQASSPNPVESLKPGLDGDANQPRTTRERERKENLGELLRLRGEVTRLRREADALSESATEALAFQARVLDVLSNTPLVRTFVATSVETVPWGQTMVLGGWRIQPGKRAVVLATIARGDDAGQVNITSKFIEYSEAVAGLARFNADSPSHSTTRALSPEQVAEVLKLARDSEGVALMEGSGVTTASGRQAQIQVVDIHQLPSGENYFTGPVLDIVPTVSSDGQSVQVVLTAQVNDRIRLPEL